LLVLDDQRPERLIIHHNTQNLESSLHPELHDLLDQYPQMVWQREQHTDLLQRIGQHISQGQELWHHKRRIKAYRGLYQ
jgi:hypothetical protein